MEPLDRNNKTLEEILTEINANAEARSKKTIGSPAIQSLAQEITTENKAVIELAVGPEGITVIYADKSKKALLIWIEVCQTYHLI